MTKQSTRKDLDEAIIGNNFAKDCIVSLFEHSKIRHYQLNCLGLTVKEEQLVRNKNAFLVGKSGTGKTFLVETCAKLYNVPLYSISATELTLTGAHNGIKLTDLLKSIKAYAAEFLKNNSTKYFSIDGVMQQMVIFIDEFDKLNSNGAQGDWYKRVQGCFLKFFENKEPGFEHITFIFAGAFMNSNVYEEKHKSKSIGFFTEHNINESYDTLEEKIIEWGILPEIVGRIHHIVQLDTLKIDDYRAILIDKIIPKKSKELLTLTGKEFELKEEEIEAVLKDVVESGQGIRKLIKKVDEITLQKELSSDKYDFLLNR